MTDFLDSHTWMGWSTAFWGPLALTIVFCMMVVAWAFILWCVVSFIKSCKALLAGGRHRYKVVGSL